MRAALAGLLLIICAAPALAGETVGGYPLNGVVLRTDACQIELIKERAYFSAYDDEINSLTSVGVPVSVYLPREAHRRAIEALEKECGP